MDQSKVCAGCKKPESRFPQPLKRCARCKSASYCGRECQKADWKFHKKTCSSQVATVSAPGTQNTNASPYSSSASSTSNPLGSAGDLHSPGFHDFNILFGLSKNDFLHNLSETDTYKRLIDSYRMRVEDEYIFAGHTRGLYSGDDPEFDFKDFLNLAEQRDGILPSWWNSEKRRDCSREAKSNGWSDIRCVVERSDIQEHYGDKMMPMKLRILAEKVYEKGCLS